MITSLDRSQYHTYFVIREPNEKYIPAIKKLQFIEYEDGFAREFPKNIPAIEKIFRQFSNNIENVILQELDLIKIPWQEALVNFLEILSNKRNMDLNWWITGSAAIALQGVEITPHDFDLVCDVTTAEYFGELLNNYLIEPVINVDDWICKRFGRAFLGVRFEWSGGIRKDFHESIWDNFGNPMEKKLRTINFHGYDVRVPPLNELLKQSKAQNLTDRVKKIKSILSSTT